MSFLSKTATRDHAFGIARLNSCQFIRRVFFTRNSLMRLQLIHNLLYLITGKSTQRAIASTEEVLALKPNLVSLG